MGWDICLVRVGAAEAAVPPSNNSNVQSLAHGRSHVPLDGFSVTIHTESTSNKHEHKLSLPHPSTSKRMKEKNGPTVELIK